MYDALIKDLRELQEFDHLRLGHVCGQAADAIEELSKYVDTMKRLKHEGWYLQQSKFHDGYNAIFTMQIPKPPKEVE